MFLSDLYGFLKSLWGGLFLKWAIAIIVFIMALCALKVLICPPGLQQRWSKGIKQAGIKNALGEVPLLCSVRRDRNRDHGKVLVIRNMGIPIDYFDKKISEIEAFLNGKVYQMEYGKNTKLTYLFYLPHRYVRPRIISVYSDELTKVPNFLVVGKTGSGKSYALTVLLALFAHADKNTKIYVCDYKNSFPKLSSCPHYFGYNNALEGIREVFDIFSERLSTPEIERDKTPVVLMVDEYGALVSAQDRKIADEIKAKIGNVLFMGRSLGIKVLIGVQRADASYFQAGARDQFHAILALGNISKEQKGMLFSDYKENIANKNGTGEGYLLIDGQDIERVKVAPVRDFGEINASIIEALSR